MTQLTHERFFVSPGDIQENFVRSARAQVAADAFFSIGDLAKFRVFLRGRCSGTRRGGRGWEKHSAAMDTMHSTHLKKRLSVHGGVMQRLKMLITPWRDSAF